MEFVPTAFAVLDILGYGRFMRRDPGEVLTLVQELLDRSGAESQFVQRDLDRYAHFSGTEPVPGINCLQFSDTLLIWLCSDPRAPDQLQKPSQLVQSICYVVSLTLASFIATGLALRGAVGFGNTYVSRDPLFFTGWELYETAQLERKQAWAGAALHDSAVEALTANPSEQFIVPYLVPMSEAGAPRPKFAVDWVTCLMGTIIPPWDLLFSSEDEGVVQKKEETRQFFEAIKQQHRPFTTGIALETVMAMRERLAAILSDH